MKYNDDKQNSRCCKDTMMIMSGEMQVAIIPETTIKPIKIQNTLVFFLVCAYNEAIFLTMFNIFMANGMQNFMTSNFSRLWILIIAFFIIS